MSAYSTDVNNKLTYRDGEKQRKQYKIEWSGENENEKRNLTQVAMEISILYIIRRHR